MTTILIKLSESGLRVLITS